MKRLLCVLMVMVMAVLMVPAIAEEYVEIYILEVSPAEAATDGCGIKGSKKIEPLGPESVASWNLTAIAAPGWEFKRWVATNVENVTSSTNPWILEKSTIQDAQKQITITAYFEKVETKEPEPIVVVEEKKPEEPHVHAEEWVPGTPATCTSTGLTDGSKCKWCGEVMQAQTEIPKIDHVYSMWVPNGSGKHFASCLYCGNKIDAACEKVQLPIKSTSGAAVILCPVCGDCNGATATAVKGLKVGEGAPYRGTLRVWNIDAGDNNKYLAVSFDRFGKVMQPEGEVSVTLPDDLKGTTAGVIGADGSVTTVQESNGTLKLDFTGSTVVVLKGN